MTTNLLLIPVALVVMWVFFLCYASLRNHWNDLRPEVKAAGLIIVLIGFVLDVLINWTIGLLLGVTRDFTLSQKCKRLKMGSGWRADVAWYICSNWLNTFDPGHC